MQLEVMVLKKLKYITLLLSSTCILAACSSSNSEMDSIESGEISYVESEQNSSKEEKFINVEKTVESLDKNNISNDNGSSESKNEEMNDVDPEENHDEQQSKSNTVDNEYGLNEEQLKKFNEIVKNNTNPNLKLDVLAKNIKKESDSTEQYMYPGKPYSEQAEVIIDDSLVIVEPEKFYPYQAVKNFKTLPYNTKVLQHEKFRQVSENQYRGKIKIQYTDGSSVIRDVTLTVDKERYSRPPTIYNNTGDHALIQRYPVNQDIQNKLDSASDYVDLKKYENELREVESQPVNGPSAVENLAFVIGINVADITQYGVAERENDNYLVQFSTKDGRRFEGLVHSINGAIVSYDEVIDGE